MSEKQQVTYHWSQGTCGEPGCCSWDESTVEFSNHTVDENVGTMYNVDDLKDYLATAYGADWQDKFEVDEENCSFY